MTKYEEEREPGSYLGLYSYWHKDTHHTIKTSIGRL